MHYVFKEESNEPSEHIYEKQDDFIDIVVVMIEAVFVIVDAENYVEQTP